MKFRPCIDIHNGKVKQIVGGTLNDENQEAKENFASSYDAAHYALMYRRDGLKGGHVIMLNKAGQPGFEATRQQACRALAAYPGGLQIGGGISDENAGAYLRAGASHVIVTSFAFAGGRVRYGNLEKLRSAAGREHIVLDLSCRQKDGVYYVVTDRWQTFTEEPVSTALLEKLSGYCDEFLIHGVDVEGLGGGMEKPLIRILAQYDGHPVTYAGGIAGLDDISRFSELGKGKLDYTIGSALDIFGGTLSYEDVNKL